MGGRCLTERVRCLVAVALALSVFMLTLSVCACASSPIVSSDDWRYRALAELGRGGLLYEDDAARFASGMPVTDG
jgi:hypothetical protein